MGNYSHLASTDSRIHDVFHDPDPHRPRYPGAGQWVASLKPGWKLKNADPKPCHEIRLNTQDKLKQDLVMFLPYIVECKCTECIQALVTLKLRGLA